MAGYDFSKAFGNLNSAMDNTNEQWRLQQYLAQNQPPPTSPGQQGMPYGAQYYSPFGWDEQAQQPLPPLGSPVYGRG